MRIRIIGIGRAGGSFARALAHVGHEVVVAERHDDPAMSASDVDVVLLAVPDRAIAAVAERITPGPATILHCSGATTLAPVRHHPRHGSIHPLMTLPDATTGARRLLDDCTFAVDGDAAGDTIVRDLGGTAIRVDDDRRALYHAAAAITSNHTVALAGQVAAIADELGLPAEAFWGLLRASVDSIVDLGPEAALTGPAARGDIATLRAHLEALPEDEREAYRALARRAGRLASREIDFDPRPGEGRLSG